MQEDCLFGCTSSVHGGAAAFFKFCLLQFRGHFPMLTYIFLPNGGGFYVVLKPGLLGSSSSSRNPPMHCSYDNQSTQPSCVCLKIDLL